MIRNASVGDRFGADQVEMGCNSPEVVDWPPTLLKLIGLADVSLVGEWF